jgi:hypothetical protein
MQFQIYYGILNNNLLKILCTKLKEIECIFGNETYIMYAIYLLIKM